MILRNQKESSFAVEPIPANFDFVEEKYTPTPIDFKEIWIIQKGGGELIIDSEVFNLKANTIYFVKKGQIPQLRSTKNLLGYCIKYKNEFIPSAGLSYKSSFYSKLNGYISDFTQITFNKKEIEDINNHLAVLLEEYYQPDVLFTSKSIVQHLFISLILKIERKARDLAIHSTELKTSSVEKKLYKRFLDLLEENFMVNHNVSFYADKLTVTKRKLSDTIKLFNNHTAKTHVLNRVILESKRLLAYSNKSIKEICFDLGFENPSYFSNLFKDITGKTPGQFRKQHRDA